MDFWSSLTQFLSKILSTEIWHSQKSLDIETLLIYGGRKEKHFMPLNCRRLYHMVHDIGKTTHIKCMHNMKKMNTMDRYFLYAKYLIFWNNRNFSKIRVKPNYIWYKINMGVYTFTHNSLSPQNNDFALFKVVCQLYF